MFIAIIAAHYNQFRRESSKEDNISFFTVIKKILASNMFNKKDQNKTDKQCMKLCSCCDLKGFTDFLFGAQRSR
jgi:hypothetical protein